MLSFIFLLLFTCSGHFTKVTKKLHKKTSKCKVVLESQENPRKKAISYRKPMRYFNRIFAINPLGHHVSYLQKLKRNKLPVSVLVGLLCL